jgi:phosphatidylethanolamine-binding protein (PEBP) family uncharacterized protein
VNIMKSTKRLTFAVTGFGLALAFGGCGSSSSNGTGTAGTTGSGGSNTGTAGTTGSGGSATGGTTGTGGSATGTGGSATGTGGSATGSGGSATGTGGSATGTGGSATGTGGSNGGSSGGSGGGAGGSGGGEGGRGGSSSGGRGGGGGSSGGATGSGGSSGGTTGSGGSGAGGASGFMLTSPGLADGAKFDPTMYTCQMSGGTFGSGINPELDWTGVPAGTKSFVITFIDTSIADKNPNDTKSQHWAIWNIPWDSTTGKVAQFPKATKTLSGDLANAKQSGTYLAPCAQGLANAPNDDQYAYTIYALSTSTLTISGTSVMSVLTALKTANIIGMAVLHGHAGNMGM